jgi:ribosomal protein S27AE
VTAKHKGKCPFCGEDVIPEIQNENFIRRDECLCPECSKSIYVCQSPGCDNYAKGGGIYDDKLCPECTRGIASNGGVLITGALMTVIGIILEKVINKKS